MTVELNDITFLTDENRVTSRLRESVTKDIKTVFGKLSSKFSSKGV